jgi:hypothetical protein
MALPDYFKVEQGTAIIWGEAGASGVTHTLSFDALANAAARQGASADLGSDWDRDYAVYIIIETGTAPTAGNTVDLYLVNSRDGSEWPAKVTGSDGAYTLGTADANLRQAGPAAASLVATADADTVLIQAPVVWRPIGRYVAPIVDNNLGQAIRDEATATNNGSRVILIPLIDKVVD